MSSETRKKGFINSIIWRITEDFLFTPQTRGKIYMLEDSGTSPKQAR